MLVLPASAALAAPTTRTSPTSPAATLDRMAPARPGSLAPDHAQARDPGASLPAGGTASAAAASTGPMVTWYMGGRPADLQFETGTLEDQARDLGPWDEGRRALYWLALVVLLGAIAWRARRRLPAAGALFLGAFAVRAMVPVWAPIHANDHGLAELRGLAGFVGQLPYLSEASHYGYAPLEIYRAILAPVHGGAKGALALSVIFGALASVAAWALARTLFESEAAGLLAGLFVALLPAHVWLSASESIAGLAGTLWLAALALGLSAQRTGRRIEAWACALALANATELWVTTMVFPLSAILFFVIVAPAGARRRSAKLLGIPLLTATLLAFALHLYALWPVLTYAEVNRGAEAIPMLLGFMLPRHHGSQALGAAPHWRLPLLSVQNLLSAPVLTAGLAPLALVATFAVGRRKPRIVLALLATWLVTVAPNALINPCLTDRLRYQTVPALLLVVLVSGVVAGIPWLRATLLAAAVSCAGVPGLVELARTPPLRNASYALDVRAAARMPNTLTVRVPPAEMGDDEITAQFPDFLFAGRDLYLDFPPGTQLFGYRSGHRPATVSFARSFSRPAGACFDWIPPACYSFLWRAAGTAATARFKGEPIRPECVSLAADVDPRAKAAFAAPLAVPWRAAGFYWIPARRPWVGFFPCRRSHDADGSPRPRP